MADEQSKDKEIFVKIYGDREISPKLADIKLDIPTNWVISLRHFQTLTL